MFVSIITALLAGLLAGTVSALTAKNKTGSIVIGIIAFILQFFISIWGLPTIGFFYPGIWICALIAIGIGALVSLFITEIIRETTETSFKGLITLSTVFIVFLLIVIVTTPALFHYNKYKNLVGEVKTKKFTEDVPLIDNKRTRLVPPETALTLAKKVLGQAKGGDVLGSQLEIDAKSAAIQKVNGELWWIFPLDFAGFFKWFNRGTVPGYIRVSAQDPTREAQLIDKNPKTGKDFELRYTRNAFFGLWLDRKVYSELPFINREEFTLEVNENWKPYYVVSLTEPQVGFSGYQTKGVAIIDPQTGKITKYNSEKDIPEWIDRVKPYNQALNQLEYWGKYLNGYWNTWFGKRGLREPTQYNEGPNIWFTEMGGKCYWFTGITSKSANDQSLVGLALIETSSIGPAGVTYYEMQGTDENGVIETVDSNLGADSSRWQPTQPIPYNIYGNPTWVVPVVSGEGIFQKVALVKMDNINTIAIASDLNRALSRYRALLSQRGNEIAPSSISDTKTIGFTEVLRKGSTITGGEKTFLFQLKGAEDKLFSTQANTKKTKAASIVQIGDKIKVKFIETEEMTIPIESLEVKGIKLRKSQIQKDYEAQRRQTRKIENNIEDTRSAEKLWEQMSPEEKREAMKKLKQ